MDFSADTVPSGLSVCFWRLTGYPLFACLLRGCFPLPHFRGGGPSVGAWRTTDACRSGQVVRFLLIARIVPHASAIVVAASIVHLWGTCGTVWAICMATVLSDPRHVRYVEWEVARAIDAQSPKTQLELAAELGVSARTLRDWAAREDVQARRRELAIQAGGDPVRITQVMNALFQTATDTESAKQVAAAATWAKMAGVIVPKEDGRKRKDASQELRDMGLSAEALQELLLKAAAPKVVPDTIAEIEAR